MMENMGLRVISEHPLRMEVDGSPVYIQDFEVESASGEIDVESPRRGLRGRLRAHLARRRRERRFQPPGARRQHGHGARSRCCAATASTCCRPACRSRRATWRKRSTAIRCWPGCWSSCSKRASIRARASDSKAEIKQGQERFAQQLRALAGGDEATLNRAAVRDRNARRKPRAPVEATHKTLLKADGPRRPAWTKTASCAASWA